MKRTGKLGRRTEMPRGEGPQRRTRLRSVSPRRTTAATEEARTAPLGTGTPLRRTAPQTMRRWRYTGPPPDVRDALITRARGRCEIGARCGGFAEGVDPAHRRGKGAGGTSLPESNAITNLLWACRACHDYIDHEEPADAEAHGWKVPHGAFDPAGVSVMIASAGGGVTVWLTEAGGYSTAPPTPAVPDGA